MVFMCVMLIFTLKVATETRITFSLTADLAISTNKGIISYFLLKKKKKVSLFFSGQPRRGFCYSLMLAAMSFSKVRSHKQKII